MMRTASLSREPVWTDTDFIGRNEVIASIAGKLNRDIPQNCNIIGEPRIGKTSLLHTIYRRKIGLTPQMNGIYVWIRLIEWADRQPVVFWAQLLHKVLQEANRAGVVLTDLVESKLDSAWLLYQTIENILNRLQSLQPQTRVIVLIDDFELLIPDITAQGLDWLRALASRFAPILAFVITTTDPLEQVCRPLVAKQISPLTNIFTTQHLGLLAEEEAYNLIQTTAEAEGGTRQANITKDFLRSEVGRHPDLLKLGCGYIFQAWDEDAGNSNTTDLLTAVSSDIRIDSHVNWLCGQLYERRSEEERGLLVSLAKGDTTGDPILFRRLERKYGLVEVRGVHPTLFSDAFRYWIASLGVIQLARSYSDLSMESVSGFQYSIETREVRVGDQIRALSVIEDRLLRYLLSKKNQVCTTQELLDNVWGADRTVSVVEKTVNRLRDKIEFDATRPRILLAVRGEGYVLRKPN